MLRSSIVAIPVALHKISNGLGLELLGGVAYLLIVFALIALNSVLNFSLQRLYCYSPIQLPFTQESIESIRNGETFLLGENMSMQLPRAAA